MNNLKRIRELYGATQEHVAQAFGVNRVTLANWENGASVASDINQEKLSIFYGIGPEFFYKKELDAVVDSMIVETSRQEKNITEQSGGERNKAEDLNRLFSKTSFDSAIRQYMFAMKILLATADNGNLDDLKKALLVNNKMGDRLEAFIKLREQEEIDKKNANEATLFELLDSFSDEE